MTIIPNYYTQIHYKLFDYMTDRLIALVGRVFANGPRDLSSVPGRVML